uniref:Ovule protein n=1 Tax=Mesocestoides corti TaxID=53468 RepID=A0A5K3G1S8_MESCO
MHSLNPSCGSSTSTDVHRNAPNITPLPSSIVSAFPAWMLQRQCAPPTLDSSSNRIHLLHQNTNSYGLRISTDSTLELTIHVCSLLFILIEHVSSLPCSYVLERSHIHIFRITRHA